MNDREKNSYGTPYSLEVDDISKTILVKIQPSKDVWPYRNTYPLRYRSIETNYFLLSHHLT